MDKKDKKITNLNREFVTMKSISEEFESLEVIKKKKCVSFMKTQFKSLDKALGGGLASGLYVLGAVPSLGKSTLALQIAENIASKEHPVLYFSLEMTADRIFAKSVCRESFLQVIKYGKALKTPERSGERTNFTSGTLMNSDVLSGYLSYDSLLNYIKDEEVAKTMKKYEIDYLANLDSTDLIGLNTIKQTRDYILEILKDKSGILEAAERNHLNTIKNRLQNWVNNEEKYQKARKKIDERAEYFYIQQPNGEIRTPESIVKSIESFIDEQEQVIKEAELNSVEEEEPITVKPLVVIDYLQLLSADDSVGDKQNVDKSIQKITSLALERDITILVISSLNRASYEKPVSMDAMKESGSIEYSADVLMGLQFRRSREVLNESLTNKKSPKPQFDLMSEKNKSPRRMEIAILKQRYGESGTYIPLDYYPQFDTFLEIDEKKKNKSKSNKQNDETNNEENNAESESTTSSSGTKEKKQKGAKKTTKKIKEITASVDDKGQTEA